MKKIILVNVIIFLCLLLGGWMLFDGIYVINNGKYFGPPEPGLWHFIFRFIGINHFDLGPLFITYGVAWLYLVGLFWGSKGSSSKWLKYMAWGTLWYLIPGTVVAIVILLLLRKYENYR
ncbi:MAG: hypothetical protein RML72_12255 [Bacteroidia bacterium]|nr:hypothetical protein [Bacteroidia bacterium]MDW8159630.1 hypothetical protein [Bacteroidia bacterium]